MDFYLFLEPNALDPDADELLAVVPSGLSLLLALYHLCASVFSKVFRRVSVSPPPRNVEGNQPGKPSSSPSSFTDLAASYDSTVLCLFCCTSHSFLPAYLPVRKTLECITGGNPPTPQKESKQWKRPTKNTGGPILIWKKKKKKKNPTRFRVYR